MLQLLRAHQKWIFICIAVVVICSFSFFGTYSTLGRGDVGSQVVSDHTVGRAVDGSNMSNLDIEILTRLIQSDKDFSKDFVMTGLGMLVAERYFPKIQPDVQGLLDRAKHYVPYVHPHIPFLNIQMVWNHFVPGMAERVAYIQEAKVATPEVFGLLSALYVDQMHLPPEQVKSILNYYQNQYGKVKPDPRFERYDCALFGFRSLEEWFGPNWVRLMAQCIFNGASIAESLGYEVSLEEALMDLQSRVQASVYHDEKKVLSLWRKMMLMRTYLASVGESVVLDSLSHARFSSYAREAIDVEIYELPEALRLNSFFDLLKLQVYSEFEKLPVRAIEKSAPGLVEQPFVIEYAEVSREQLLSEISLKDMWDWQLQDAGWERLCTHFDMLKQVETSKRFEFLESLDTKTRFDVDVYTQTQMLRAHPEWIDRALALASKKQLALGVRLSGIAGIPFSGLKKAEDIVPLLHLASLPGEEVNEPLQILQRFSLDDKVFYKIHVIERSLDKKLVSCAQVMHDGTLEALVHGKLKEAYPEVRKKHPVFFKEENGQWKPFEEVLERVGAIFYKDFLNGICNEEPDSLEGYAHAYTKSYMKQVREAFKKNAQDVPLAVSKREAHITRKKGMTAIETGWFTLAEGELSTVDLADTGPCFAKIKNHQVVEKADGLDVELAQQLLSMDARRFIMSAILDEIEKKQAIY